jgi:putative acetyltransferase
MQVRRFRLSDAEALAWVFHTSVREGGRRHYSPEQVVAWSPAPPDAEAYSRRAEDHALFVAVNDEDQPIGYADLGSNGYIDHLYCQPIGTGIGSALYAAVEAAAVSAGIAVLSVDASKGARPMFERRGFHVEERRELKINSVAIHNYRMSKTLKGQATL